MPGFVLQAKHNKSIKEGHTTQKHLTETTVLGKDTKDTSTVFVILFFGVFYQHEKHGVLAPWQRTFIFGSLAKIIKC